MGMLPSSNGRKTDGTTEHPGHLRQPAQGLLQPQRDEVGRGLHARRHELRERRARRDPDVQRRRVRARLSAFGRATARSDRARRRRADRLARIQLLDPRRAEERARLRVTRDGPAVRGQAGGAAVGLDGNAGRRAHAVRPAQDAHVPRAAGAAQARGLHRRRTHQVRRGRQLHRRARRAPSSPIRWPRSATGSWLCSACNQRKARPAAAHVPA